MMIRASTRFRDAVVRRRSMDMELRYADVSEMYRTLERHSVNIDAQELALAHSLAEKWRDLCVRKNEDLRLAEVKEDFRRHHEQSEAFEEPALRTVIVTIDRRQGVLEDVC